MTERPSIRKWPEGDRPREKLIQLGAESLTDTELLAILLRVGNEGASAIDMGRLLVDELGGLQGVDRAHAEEIMAIKGLVIAKTAQLKAAIEIGKRVRRLNVLPIAFDSAHAIAAYCYLKFEGVRHEQNRLIYLFEPQEADDRVPFDLNTFKYVQVSQAAEIPGRPAPGIKAILEEAGAVLEGHSP